ncbi:hypothetical protein [Paenibacillus protaetiae]|uniref:Uncharacterized protein n=1 Tax=Paenibacillus protaetiae TaxID=2509456 RepID=A0A4P6EXI3_9BACL|nr:hypothetical protein [Paenibacillus protaetiae]QAY67365.1 hypothetical protein ET464_14155 [Paenibacillus protaetiae]
MADKTVSISSKQSAKPNVKRLVTMTTIAAWTVLSVGIVLCLFNLHDFNDRNVGLMIGIGFLIASVFIYTLGMGVNMVDAYATNKKKEDDGTEE